MYAVIVGNIGTVVETKSLPTALDTWVEYYVQSATQYGRAASESVVLLEEPEGRLIRDYQPPEDEELDDTRVALFESRMAVRNCLIEQTLLVLGQVAWQCGNVGARYYVSEILEHEPFDLAGGDMARWTCNAIEAIGGGYAACLVRHPDALMKQLLDHLRWCLTTLNNLPKPAEEA